MYLQSIICIFLLTVVSVAAAPPPDTAAHDAFIAEASRKMSEAVTVHAAFTQTKQLKAFQVPLVITGEVFIDKRGKFAWHIQTPVRYSCVIDGDRLQQWDADTDRVLSLNTKDNPSLKMLTDSMRNYFSGRFDRMREGFHIVSARDAKLVMAPKKGFPAEKFIRDITFTFSPDLTAIREIAITEPSDDSTRIVFTRTELNRDIPSEKWQPRQK